MREIAQGEFEQAIASGSVVLDFFTSSCSPCKRMLPIVEEVERKRGGIAFLKVNAQTCPDLAVRFAVRCVPTFVVINDGAVKGQKSGEMTALKMQDWIDDCLRT